MAQKPGIFKLYIMGVQAQNVRDVKLKTLQTA